MTGVAELPHTGRFERVRRVFSALAVQLVAVVDRTLQQVAKRAAPDFVFLQNNTERKILSDCGLPTGYINSGVSLEKFRPVSADEKMNLFLIFTIGFSSKIKR